MASEETPAAPAPAPAPATAAAPKKRHYRQRAHSNPLSDHFFADKCVKSAAPTPQTLSPRHHSPARPQAMDWRRHYGAYLQRLPQAAVRNVDIGCGYGGLLREALLPWFCSQL